MPERNSKTASYLSQAHYFENCEDYVGAIQAIHQGLCEDPQNAALRKKREDLPSIICWRC